MVLSDYEKQRILYCCHSGKNYAEIAHCLTAEGHRATKVGVLKFIQQYKEIGTISHKPGSSQASKMMNAARQIIKEQMTKDDETTGCKLQKLLSKHGITGLMYLYYAHSSICCSFIAAPKLFVKYVHICIHTPSIPISVLPPYNSNVLLPCTCVACLGMVRLRK